MNVRFVGSFKSDFLKDKPHIVFVGRSNAGKSSLINMLVNRKVAYVSKEPGRTRFINLFELDRKLYIADAPGYGFAKVSKAEQENWKKLMENYFFECKDAISKVFLLIDSVVGPTELDKMMISWLEHLNLRYTVVLTKIDKASQREIAQTVSKLKTLTDRPIVLTSSKEGRGKRELLSFVFA